MKECDNTPGRRGLVWGSNMVAVTESGNCGMRSRLSSDVHEEPQAAQFDGEAFDE